MKCEKCGAKMKCTFSAPTGIRTRYRVHKCPECNLYLNTTEMPISWIEAMSGSPEDFNDRMAKLKSQINSVIKRHISFIRKTKKGSSG